MEGQPKSAGHKPISGCAGTIASTLSAMRKWSLVLSFVLGLAATVAAVALAAGDEPAGGEVVTSVAQLRGVSFVSSCAFSHRAPDDPIVYPGRPGASHDHTFLGSATTDAFSTDASLRAAATTCKRRGETAAYWVPTLFAGTQAILPAATSVYYRRGTLADVKPFPPGLRMIAGVSTATSPQALSVTRWDCGIEAHVAATSEPPVCPPGPRTALRLHVTFPDCWDGQSLDTSDHHSHMAYDVEGQCPSTHPVALPELELILRYPEVKGPLALSSGGVYSAHADFVNTWDQGRLEGLVTDCLNGLRFCGGGG
jgi:hypothetical protein